MAFNESRTSAGGGAMIDVGKEPEFPPDLRGDNNFREFAGEARRRRRELRIKRWYLFASIPLALAILAAPLVTHSQSGRQTQPKPANRNKRQPAPKPVVTTNQTTSNQNSNSEAARDHGDDSSDVVRVSSNLVPVPTTVLDSRGIALTNLKLEDFELRIDGQPNPITDLIRSESPVRMAMLFDNSRSQDQSRDFEKHAATRFFRNVMRPMDQAAIYAVSTEVDLVQPMTNDVHRLQQTIESFGEPEGATSLYDGIFEAVTYLKPYLGRRVIVIVSDGRDTTSRADHDFDATMLRLLADECQVYVVQTGVYENANVRDLAAERRMQEFASQTGGAAFIPRSAGDLEKAFTQIAADLAQQYVLSYYPAADKRDGRYHVIAVRVKAQPNARVRARKGFLVRSRDRV